MLSRRRTDLALHAVAGRAATPPARTRRKGGQLYLHVTYDYERVKQREILMARFTERTFWQAAPSPGGRLRMLVDVGTGAADVAKTGKVKSRPHLRGRRLFIPQADPKSILFQRILQNTGKSRFSR